MIRYLLFAVALTGCVRHTLPPDPRTRMAPPRTFQYATASDFALEAQAPESDDYDLLLLRYPSADPTDDKNPEVRAQVRRPKGTPRGLILVLPILGGDYGPSNAFAIHLAEAGFSTIRFDRKSDIFDPEKDFAHTALVMERGVVDVRRSLDWKEIPRLRGRGQIGILGISMGSFVATHVAATDKRISASVFALGGGDLPKVIYAARSETEIGAMFDALRGRGWDAERIQNNVVEHLAPLDPVRYAPSIEAKGVLMVHARFDAVVPYEYGTKLWKASGRPRRIVLFSGHYTAALYLPYLQSAIEKHFVRYLSPG